MENDINCSIFWENSMDHQTDPFQSALSSMVSSPTASNNGNLDNSIVVRELIGRLNCDSEFNNTSSCYNTPLNSPPKLNLSIMENRDFSSLSPFSTDPGFAHRAATFSPFAAKYDVNNKLSRCSTPESSVSEQIPIGGLIGHSSRKRKSNPKGKGKEHAAPASVKKHPNNITSENSESSAKRSKSEDENDANDNNNNNNSKALESQKDYIHVRARRGQATDAHSLAERVRREKIGERMKVLQDLVPGCNKVTGKAVMLDEIINYVQSLQRQVEFLSMKLATVDPRMDVNTEVLVSNSKDMFHNIYPSDSFAFGGNQMMQLPHIDNFSETASQVSTVWEDDLHSVVQMGFGQNQTHNFREIYPSAEMKVEL